MEFLKANTFKGKVWRGMEKERTNCYEKKQQYSFILFILFYFISYFILRGRSGSRSEGSQSHPRVWQGWYGPFPGTRNRRCCPRGLRVRRLPSLRKGCEAERRAVRALLSAALNLSPEIENLEIAKEITCPVLHLTVSDSLAPNQIVPGR